MNNRNSDSLGSNPFQIRMDKNRSKRTYETSSHAHTYSDGDLAGEEGSAEFEGGEGDGDSHDRTHKRTHTVTVLEERRVEEVK